VSNLAWIIGPHLLNSFYNAILLAKSFSHHSTYIEVLIGDGFGVNISDSDLPLLKGSLNKLQSLASNSGLVARWTSAFASLNWRLSLFLGVLLWTLVLNLLKQ
jgi:hypothetical protein